MPETYIPTSRTSRPTNGLQALSTPQWSVSANTTPVTRPSAYEKPLDLPKQATDLDSLLQAIQNIDELSFIPAWQSNWKRKRALEIAQVLRDFGGYNDLKWNATSGIASPYLKFMLQLTYPSYRNMFSKGGQFESLEFPDTGISVDFPHFNAAFSRYMDCYSDDCAIPTEWASWAGDMFTYAAHLDSIRKKEGLSYAAIRDSALNYIGGNHPRYSELFGTGDFYADIDARNIASLINNRGLSFYEAMDRYYKQKDFDRFGTFIHSYGGWKNLSKK